MQKVPFWGCPKLCLWLTCLVMLCSCVVKHKGESMEKYIAADTTGPLWKVEVFMVPVKWMAGTPGGDLDFVLQPYNIKKIRFAGNNQVLQLSFRANNPEQADRLREQLLATGVVEQVNVTKESN